MMARHQPQLIIRQQPQRAQVVQENNPKNRKPIDPPPIIELRYEDVRDPINSQWLVSPRTFMMVTMVGVKDGGAADAMPCKHLIGQTVSSLHRLKDINNKDGGFFVFGDISARKVGQYKLRFSLFDTQKDSEEVMYMGSVESEVMHVLPQRDFGSMSESTHLTRTFSDQGVKLRVRKDNRSGSGIGSKRSYNNASPQDTSSPSNQNMYGGAVQDHHYTSSTQSPAIKRQRSSGDYETSNMYQHMAVGQPPAAHYQSSVSSGARAWAGSDQHRVTPNGYGHHAQSPMNMAMMNRSHQSMGVQSQASWQDLNQQSALPSPSSSHHQPSYPTASASSQHLPGATAAASAVPRQYFQQQSYPYPTPSPYQAQAPDVSQAYPDLSHMPGSSISDTAGISSGQNSAYNPAYLQSGGLYPAEPGEVQGGYPAFGMTDAKF